MKNPRLTLLFLLLVPALLTAQPKINFNKVTGVIKPVNGVGQPPLYSWDHTDLFHYLKEAGIPYSRLHDVGGPFGMNIYVDIPNIFRDFDADENDPASYDFAFTDILMKGLVDNGVEPYYRLGVTIENAQYGPTASSRPRISPNGRGSASTSSCTTPRDGPTAISWTSRTGRSGMSPKTAGSKKTRT